MKAKVRVFVPIVFGLVISLALLLSACGGQSDGSQDQTQPASSDVSPAIISQPEDVMVSYPEGATFSVEVDHPEAVASYQWIMVDQVGNEFILEGSSAHTDTLVVPSTQQLSAALDFYCLVTGLDGSETASEAGQLDADNRDIAKPVFYVGEYAVEPGETLDLASVDIGDGYQLGSGTVAFDENGRDITITDLDYDNSHFMGGVMLAPNVGIGMVYDHPEPEEYNVTFVGENRIMNTYYDPEYNASGIPFDYYFTGVEEENGAPVVNFIGDGSLTVTNGTNAIRIIGDLLIDIDVTIDQTLENYGDGIVAQNMLIEEGNTLDLEVYGSALYASGNLFLNGADLTVDAHAPHISVGIATKNILQSGGTMMLDHSNVAIQANADPEISAHVAGMTGLSASGELFITNGSNVSYTASAEPNEEIYASHFMGVYAARAEIEDSAVQLNMDCPYIFIATGIYTDEDLELRNSDLAVDIHTGGTVTGVTPEGTLRAENTAVNVAVAAYDDFSDEGDCICYGILCKNFDLTITDPAVEVRSFADGGMALGCNLDDVEDDFAEYEEGYQGTLVTLNGNAICRTPANAVINLGNVQQGDESYRYYIHVETYYDAQDTSAPAAEVVFGA